MKNDHDVFHATGARVFEDRLHFPPAHGRRIEVPEGIGHGRVWQSLASYRRLNLPDRPDSLEGIDEQRLSVERAPPLEGVIIAGVDDNALPIEVGDEGAVAVPVAGPKCHRASTGKTGKKFAGAARTLCTGAVGVCARTIDAT